MPDIQAHYRWPDGEQLARAAIELMKRHAIPTSPANYEIWVNHAAGARCDLSRAIDAHIASGEPFTDTVNEDLFEQFFANTRLTVEMVEASESIARELAEVMSTLRAAGADAGSYAHSLQQTADHLDTAVERPADLRVIVAGLAAATRQMAAKNQELVAQMETSSRQVESLQTTLQSVRVEALTDSLTGLANRRLFDETLRRRLAECEADQSSLCLMLCDIDHFKRFNDTWGHLVGDQVIRLLAGVLRDNSASDFLPARYGGEEFALIMPRTALAGASAVSCRVHETIRARKLTRRSTGELIGVVTISIGVAQWRAGESAADLIDRADACLYEAKRGGRDRIVVDRGVRQPNAA